MLQQWIGERWSERGDDAIESCRALRVGFYCFRGAASRRCFDLSVNFEFAVGIGYAVFFSVRCLELIVKVVGLGLKTGGSFKVSDCFGRLSLVQQNLSQLVLCIEVVRMRSDYLAKKCGSLVGL